LANNVSINYQSSGIMNRYYTGIGSRRTPTHILLEMTRVARVLSDATFTLRSGGAVGADQAFQNGSNYNANIYLPQDLDLNSEESQLCYELLQPHLPFNLRACKPYTQQLLLRNMQQLFGVVSHGEPASRFVICYTPTKNYTSFEAGGTRYAVLVALYYDIPVINMLDVDWKQQLKSVLYDMQTSTFPSTSQTS
jgi:hypothetical protein